MTEWSLTHIDKKLIKLALEEDLQQPWCDLTTTTLFGSAGMPSSSHKAGIHIVSKMYQPVVMCGTMVIKELLSYFPKACVLDSCVSDGELIAPQASLLKISGDANVILMLERVLLNFLQHLIAIATWTKQFVAKVATTDMKILDTRKTTPGWRHLEKYAVYCGGGVNHRMGLYDAIMIKDTHSDMLGGLQNALAKLATVNTIRVPVIVEVRNQAELETVLQQKPGLVTRVLLDNMDEAQLRQSVKACQGVISTEASGNINLNTIEAVAATGVNYASIGALTHSAPHVDLSMREQFHG